MAWIDEQCRAVMTACACEAVRRTARSLTGVYQAALAPSGVRVAQLPILVAAHLMGPLPLTAMAEALVIDRTTLTRNLKALEDDGLVSIGDDADGRRRLIVLTTEGTARLETALGAWRAVQDEVGTSFGVDRLSAMVTELAALTQATRP